MTDSGINKLILVSALEAELQGMIADNKQREIDGSSLAYDERQFTYIADQMRSIIDEAPKESKFEEKMRLMLEDAWRIKNK